MGADLMKWLADSAPLVSWIALVVSIFALVVTFLNAQVNIKNRADARRVAFHFLAMPTNHGGDWKLTNTGNQTVQDVSVLVAGDSVTEDLLFEATNPIGPGESELLRYGNQTPPVPWTSNDHVWWWEQRDATVMFTMAGSRRKRKLKIRTSRVR